ncbi:N-6 DNA methylase [Micromonospora sp. NPDC047548]|uniref:N-6 DNA methylase n=1 Tax=Micromonospora sp. NPDC047548 TaxID=3155624 RepID=UPI0033DAC2D4
MQHVKRSEISRLAGVSRAAVTSWAKRRDFPRPSGDGRFALSEVLEWLDSRQVHGSIRGADDGTECSYADRVRRSLAAAEPRDVPGMKLSGDPATAEADNLILRLTLIFLRERDPRGWAGLNDLIAPNAGAAGARWLIERIATAGERAALRHGVSPEVFAALRRLTPESVPEVRGLMARCSELGAANVQALVDAYDAALPPSAFLTPRAVAALLAEAVIDDTAESVYDPYLRAGELLIAAAGVATRPDGLRLHGLGPNATALSLSGLTLLALGGTADLRPAERARRATVTHVLANPPFGSDSWLDRRPNTDWQPFPPPPARSAFRWLLHCIEQLSDDGRAAIIMPRIAAVSTNAREREIRRRLVEDSMVEAVIALPPGLYAGMSVATSVWIVRRAPGSDQPILFVDAANLGVPRDGRTLLDEAGQASILRGWRSFLADRAVGRPHPGIEGLSAAVTKAVIRPESYSLNPAEYLPGPTRLPSVDADGARAGLGATYSRALHCRAAAEEAAVVASQPLGAQIVRLGDVCDVKAGYSYSRLRAEERSDEQGVPIVLPRHLRDGRIVADKPPRAPRTTAEALKDYWLRADDVLCVRTGALTAPALVRPAESDWLLSTNLLRLRVLDPSVLNPYYLYAYLRSAAGMEGMKTFARATVTAYVTAADVAAMEVPLPPLARQQSLVAALGALDEEAAAARDLAARVVETRDVVVRRLFGGAR